MKTRTLWDCAHQQTNSEDVQRLQPRDSTRIPCRTEQKRTKYRNSVNRHLSHQRHFLRYKQLLISRAVIFCCLSTPFRICPASRPHEPPRTAHPATTPSQTRTTKPRPKSLSRSRRRKMRLIPDISDPASGRHNAKRKPHCIRVANKKNPNAGPLDSSPASVHRSCAVQHNE